MVDTVQQILQRDRVALQTTLQLDAQVARLEVQMLLQFVLKVSRAYLLAHAERVLTADELLHYQGLLQRRLQGEPLAYVLGEREFFGLNFKVTSATLIPRPDTELLVELALSKVQRRLLDLGTGSGAIALSVAAQAPQLEVVAVDASVDVLAVAQENVTRLQLANVVLLHSDWFTALDGQVFDVIVSNPPYIEAGDVHLTQGDVRFEPRSALASGADGLDDIRRIVQQAPSHLTSRGWLMLEHGYNQAEQVRELLRAAGFVEVFSARDLAGIERVSGGRVSV